jgi:hypothetical protein
MGWFIVLDGVRDPLKGVFRILRRPTSQGALLRNVISATTRLPTIWT